jgi:hypothetical protein
MDSFLFRYQALFASLTASKTIDMAKRNNFDETAKDLYEKRATKIRGFSLVRALFMPDRADSRFLDQDDQEGPSRDSPSRQSEERDRVPPLIVVG